MASSVCCFSNRTYFSKPSLDINPKATTKPATLNAIAKLTRKFPIIVNLPVNISDTTNVGVNVTKEIITISNEEVPIKKETSSLIRIFMIATIAPQIPRINQNIVSLPGKNAPIIATINIIRNQNVPIVYFLLTFAMELY